MKTEILFGIHPIYEALKAKRRVIKDIYVQKGRSLKAIDPIISLAKTLTIPIIPVDAEHFQNIGKDSIHQGVSATVSIYPLLDYRELLVSKSPFLVILDSIVDPHNLGALIRTSFASGADGVIIPKDRSATPTPLVSKSSAGALEHIKLAQVTNLVYTMQDLKQNGIWIAGLDIVDGQNLFELNEQKNNPLDGPIALVIGGEGKGIRQLVKTNCDFLITIPMSPKMASLNASVAGAIGMYEVFRNRYMSERSKNNT